MAKKKVRRIVKFIIMGILLVPFLFPIYWMVTTAFKPWEEWVPKEAILFPHNPTWENFIILFHPEATSYVAFTTVKEPITKALTNSVILSVGGTLLALLTGTLSS
ncbi:MAG: hypothetical protein QXH17_07860, partial [Candidatus Bathyarchaeia archaeon]